MEYYDRTLFELSIEIQGYNRRWEEQWRQIRTLFTPMQNAISKKPKSAKEWIRLPSDNDESEGLDKFKKMKEAMKFKHDLEKRRGDGSGVSS